jgi:hypothetical protein
VKKIRLEKSVAEQFCEKYNNGDMSGLEALREANLEKCFLDPKTEDLLYATISMNVILNDYWWFNSIDETEEEVKPSFDNSFLRDLEDRYFKSKETLINRFSNIKFNEKTGELEIRKEERIWQC